jgi:hypothetical protein
MHIYYINVLEAVKFTKLQTGSSVGHSAFNMPRTFANKSS